MDDLNSLKTKMDNYIGKQVYIEIPRQMPDGSLVISINNYKAVVLKSNRINEETNMVLSTFEDFPKYVVNCKTLYLKEGDKYTTIFDFENQTEKALDIVQK